MAPAAADDTNLSSLNISLQLIWVETFGNVLGPWDGLKVEKFENGDHFVLTSSVNESVLCVKVNESNEPCRASQAS